MPLERYHLSLVPDLIVKDIAIENVDKGFFGKPRGLWYSFGDLWLNLIMEDRDNGRIDLPEEFSVINEPAFADYQFGYKIDLDLDGVLVISDPERLKRFVNQFEFPPERKLPGAFEAYQTYPSGKIDWKKVAKSYKGVEFSSIFGYYAPWYRGMDVPGGCIWDKSAIKSIKPVPLDQIAKSE